jgi:hypothetical protein
MNTSFSTYRNSCSFLGVFRNFEKQLIKFVMFVYMEQLGFHWMDFDLNLTI